MIIELHCHTREHSPCSKTPAMELVNAIRLRGADGMVITDHHYLWPEAELARLRLESGVPEAFLLLTAQEVFTADYGDVLVYGSGTSISHGIELAKLRQRYPEAALVWAHPYRHGHLPTAVDLLNGDFDAIEIVNPHHTVDENQRAVADWQRWGYRITSGSDIHRTDFNEFYPARFDCAIAAIQDVVACIKEGRVVPQLGKYGNSPE